MMRTTGLMRRSILSRSLAGALAAVSLAGTALVVATPALAAKPKAPEAPKIKMSKTFQPLAAALSKGLEDAKKKPEVIAAQAKVAAGVEALRTAQGNTARTAARGQRDTAVAELGTTLIAEKTQLDGVFAGASTSDDKYIAGQLAVQLGGLAQDPATQRKGLAAMLDSGKTAPADAPRLQFYLGSISYDLKDYATARTAFTTAMAAGYREGDIEALLAESYISDNQVAQGLVVLNQAIDTRRAAGTPAPQGWYRRGLGAAYKAKILDQAGAFSMALVRDYPSSDNWAGAITVLREVGGYANQESLDLMRLMDRTGSWAEGRDYVEYIQAADSRRLPGEVVVVIDKGIAAGKLQMSDVFVSDNRSLAAGRIAADKASLPALERDARAANATGATVAAAADAFLSYGQAAKAVELYTIALGKPGVDVARATTRLGIAQADSGDYAGAAATFAKVEGPRKALAQLWGIYASQKAAPPTPPAAPAVPK